MADARPDIALHRGLRAPLMLASRLQPEPGRAWLLGSDEQRGYVLPLSSDGHRLDDGPLDRLLARLDLGGGFPTTLLVVAFSLAILFVAQARSASSLRVAASCAAVIAVWSLWWAL